MAGLLDLPTDHFWDQLVHQLLQIARSGLSLHNFKHLLPDLPDLTHLGVGGLLDLVGSLLGEGNGEQPHEVTVGGLDVDVGLDESLPLADEGTELVGGEVHSVEVGETVLALNIVDSELDLPERVLVVLVEVGEGEFENSALESIGGVLCEGGKRRKRERVG